MNKNLTRGIMAIFVASQLAACTPEDKVEVLSARNVDECIAQGMDFYYCDTKFKEAEAMHLDVAPKFDSVNDCSTQFGDSCVKQTVTHSDGSSSSVWLPMMMGYMLGNTSSNLSNSAAAARPLYMSDAKRNSNGTFTGGMVTASGNAANFGSHSLSRTTATATPKSASVASTKAAVSSRGGFGASARGGFSGAS